jgi:hypothetical protein
MKKKMAREKEIERGASGEVRNQYLSMNIAPSLSKEKLLYRNAQKNMKSRERGPYHDQRRIWQRQ